MVVLCSVAEVPTLHTVPPTSSVHAPPPYGHTTLVVIDRIKYSIRTGEQYLSPTGTGNTLHGLAVHYRSTRATPHLSLPLSATLKYAFLVAPFKKLLAYHRGTCTGQSFKIEQNRQSCRTHKINIYTSDSSSTISSTPFSTWHT
jgi:hypothetical protein